MAWWVDRDSSKGEPWGSRTIFLIPTPGRLPWLLQSEIGPPLLCTCGWMHFPHATPQSIFYSYDVTLTLILCKVRSIIWHTQEARLLWSDIAWFLDHEGWSAFTRFSLLTFTLGVSSLHGGSLSLL